MSDILAAVFDQQRERAEAAEQAAHKACAEGRPAGRAKPEPPRPASLSAWEYQDAQHAGGLPPMCM